LVSFLFGLSPRDLFHRSGPPEDRNTTPQGSIARETGRYLVAINYDRDLSLSPGVGEHFIKLLRVLTYVEIDGPIPVGCPSLFTEGSSIRPIDNNLISHYGFPPC
jgi:hypothetical protein